MEEKLIMCCDLEVCMFVGTDVFGSHRLVVGGSHSSLQIASKAMNDI